MELGAQSLTLCPPFRFLIREGFLRQEQKARLQMLHSARAASPEPLRLGIPPGSLLCHSSCCPPMGTFVSELPLPQHKGIKTVPGSESPSPAALL